jgi:hypothetical protein
VCIAEHKGDSFTFLGLDLVTTQVVARSDLRSGLDVTSPNLRTIMAPDGSTPASRMTIKSNTNTTELESPTTSLSFSPDECLGKTFFCTLDNGKRYCVTIVRKIQDHDELCDSAFDKIFAYGTLCKCNKDLEDEDKAWIFTDDIGHQGPLCKSHNDYKDSPYIVLLL